MSWEHRAACATKDPNVFFPPNGIIPNDAKELCTQHCPVRKDCASAAIRRHTTHGVHGGFALPSQRTSLRRYVESFEGKKPAELVTTTCASCGSEIQARIKLTVCGSCRAHSRHESVDATPARQHMNDLRARGWTVKDIHLAADVSKPTATRVASGKVTTVSAVIAAKLLAVAGDPPARVPGMCPSCGEEMPILSASAKSGLRGHCSKRCRDARKTASVHA
ncbi:WhiB family transcriptional regulator [Nocardia sp. NPDC058519]|uniref:WhiB family transcriptional regulator n=1 Tax=Nocardia sp. NPDC058519 TaxID=3346535 RepID=UPI0036505616